MLVPDLEYFSSVMTAEMVLFSFPFVFNVNVEISEPDTILIILIRSLVMLIVISSGLFYVLNISFKYSLLT